MIREFGSTMARRKWSRFVVSIPSSPSILYQNNHSPPTDTCRRCLKGGEFWLWKMHGRNIVIKYKRELSHAFWKLNDNLLHTSVKKEKKFGFAINWRLFCVSWGVRSCFWVREGSHETDREIKECFVLGDKLAVNLIRAVKFGFRAAGPCSLRVAVATEELC